MFGLLSSWLGVKRTYRYLVNEDFLLSESTRYVERYMKEDNNLIAENTVAGNVFDKYGTKNPVARYLMKGFFLAVEDLLDGAQLSEIHEVGCGEGYLSSFLVKRCQKVRGSDVSQIVIDKARTIAEHNRNSINFKIASIYDLTPENDAAELVVCCEVMEHLTDPILALRILSKLAKPYLLVSVPREPLWRILNMMRGSYLGDLGNTPGHIQHWSRSAFLRLLSSHFDVLEVRSPLPWTIALCCVRSR